MTYLEKAAGARPSEVIQLITGPFNCTGLTLCPIKLWFVMSLNACVAERDKTDKPPDRPDERP